MAPKTVDTADKSVGGPRYMRAIVSLDDAGQVQIRTHTFCHIQLAGFTGGVLVSFSDAAGNLLWVSPMTQYGVDGQLVFWSQSDRWDNEYYTVGSDIARQADRVDVWVGWAPKNRFLADFTEVVVPVINLIKWIIEHWPKDENGGQDAGGTPLQTTYQGLTAQRGDLIAAVQPETVPYGAQASFTVTAKDSNTGADVPGVVYRSMSLPLDRAGTPIGPIGAPLTAALTGHWISQRRVEVDPDNGTRETIVVRRFVQERLYVRTADYGDVAVPFTLSGAPSDALAD